MYGHQKKGQPNVWFTHWECQNQAVIEIQLSNDIDIWRYIRIAKGVLQNPSKLLKDWKITLKTKEEC